MQVAMAKTCRTDPDKYGLTIYDGWFLSAFNN
jgi:hypothetical protein